MRYGKAVGRLTTTGGDPPMMLGRAGDLLKFDLTTFGQASVTSVSRQHLALQLCRVGPARH